MKVTIYIDGECLLCDRMAGFIYRHSVPGNFYFATLQDHTDLKSYLKTELQPHGTLVVKTGEKIYTQGQAVVFIATRMHFPYNYLGQIISCFPSLVLNGGYRFIARIRNLFGRKSSCYLPRGIDPQYFQE